MLKKTVKYTDYFGEQHTEDFYFHLPKAELTELALDEDGVIGKLQALTSDTAKGSEILKFFKLFLVKSYGERSEDGKRFIKSEEAQHEFSQTAAFDQILGDLVTYADDPVEFMKAVLPSDLAKAAEEEMGKQQGLPQDFRKKA